MKDRREYTKPTVTRVDVQPSESVLKACKPDPPTCIKFSIDFGS